MLLDGPAGTGKSRATGEYALWFLTTFDKCRVAVVRKTRVSLTESWLVTWENKVLAGVDRTYLKEPLEQGPGRGNRQAYDFDNGSRLVIAGMDNPTRLFSTEFDLIIVVEATELSENEWESLHRALRNNVAPYQQLLGECNPDAEYHWLNQRCIACKTTRLLSRHTDNPSITDEYMSRLSSLTGVRRKRLFEGLWVAAEGQIWPNFDPLVHVIDKIPSTSPIKWYFGSVDWGWRNPGSILVYGVDNDRNVFVVEEWYQVNKNIEWWADIAANIQKRYDKLGTFRCFVCDPSRPDSIDLFNHRLYQRGNRNCAIPANNDFEAGTSIVRERFDYRTLFILRSCLAHPRDPELVEMKKPCSLVEEIPSYVYREIKDGQPVREEAAPDGDDHSCDSLRYACMYLDYSKYTVKEEEPLDKPGTMGHFLGIGDALKRLSRQRR